MISRFIIKLRRAHEPEMRSTTINLSKFSSPHFHIPTIASIIGDMDQPLEHGPRTSEADGVEMEIITQEAALTNIMDVERANISTSPRSAEIGAIVR